MSVAEPPPRRPIRSFVRRARRLPPARQAALEALLRRYGAELPATGAWDPRGCFASPGPVVMEIGFGRGEALLAEAAARPEHRLLGVEVYRAGLERVLRVIDEAGLGNVRVAVADAAQLLPRLPTACLAGVRILFPDPWPKRRHRKRRLLQAEFLAECARVAAPAAVLHVATDWAEYAAQIEAAVAAAPVWEPLTACPARPETRYERRGRRRGHAVWERAWRRTPAAG